MTTRTGVLLVDTDMLILLAATGLLERTAASLGYTIAQVRRLFAVTYQVRKSKRFRDTYGEEVLQRVAQIISTIKEADPPSDSDHDLLGALTNLVDPGEAQLMAIAARDRCTLLVSGDKRAIAGLAESNATSHIQSLQGKIVSLEVVLWSLLSNQPAEDVRKTFAPVLNHKTLRIVLSEHAAADHGRCLAGVMSYYNDLHRQSKGVLYNPDPDRLGRNASPAC